MIRTRPFSLLLPAIGAMTALAGLTITRPAAAVTCDTLTNPVYITGGGKVTISLLAKALAPVGVNLVYRTNGSCLAVDAIVNGNAIPTSPTDITASYWDAMGAEAKCDLPATGQIPDIGISDVFPTTCQGLPNGLPSNVRDFFGPVEDYVFIVPKKSTQKSFSKLAGFFVYGFGADSGVDPWTDPAAIFARDANSGTQQMMSVAVGVPADKFQGTATTSSADLVTKLTTAPNAEGAIGIATGEVAASNGASVNVLAYQDADQTCGFWPDTTATATDKKNVRDGHYALWGPLHLLTTVTMQGYPTNPNAKDVIAYLTGTQDPPNGFDLITLLWKAGIVPQCAMAVTRDSELGPLASYQPERSCSCYFDSLANNTTSNCTACAADAECPETAPRCNYGFCEAQ